VAESSISHARPATNSTTGTKQPISFAAASNRRVIGSMKEFARQIESDLTRIGERDVPHCHFFVISRLP